MPKWSIIVLTTPNRYKSSFTRIIDDLTSQADGWSVEVLGLYDNKSQPLGQKRNSAVAASSGQYISFVDDDDEVSPKYVSSVMGELMRNNGTEVVFFDQITREIDHNREVYCTYSPVLPTDAITQLDENGAELRKLLVPHTAVWRRDFFERFEFGNEMPEDMIWSQKSNPGLRKWSHIKKPLYFYNFCPSFSEWERKDMDTPNAHEKTFDALTSGKTFSF